MLKNLFKKVVNKETISYLFFGILTTVLAFSLYAVFILFGFGVVLANTISTFIAILFAFVTNKIWVFKSLNLSPSAVVKEFIKFCIGRLAAFIIDTVLLVILVDILQYDPFLSKAFTSIVVVIINYFASKKIVFNK